MGAPFVLAFVNKKETFMRIIKSLSSKAEELFVGIARLIFLMSLLFIGVSCGKGNPVNNNNAAETGTVSDIDGNIYKTIKIGNQVWTVDNLRTTKYNDGKPIPYVTDNNAWAALTTPGYCYHNNTANAYRRKKYGALYNWYAVDTKKLAPAGWHVPTDAEWDFLQNYLIANGYNWDGTATGNKIAKSMAAQADWIVSKARGAIGNDSTRNNRSGFSAFPSNYRYYIGYFSTIDESGYWWSASEFFASDASFRFLYYDSDSLVKYNYDKSCGLSVRLVKD